MYTIYSALSSKGEEKNVEKSVHFHLASWSVSECVGEEEWGRSVPLYKAWRCAVEVLKLSVSIKTDRFPYNLLTHRNDCV